MTSSGEGEATQRADYEQAAEEEWLHLADALQNAEAQELDRVDAALTAVEAADSREVAVAALTRATVGINALYARAPVTAPLEIISPQFVFPTRYSVAYPNLGIFQKKRADESDRKRGERIEKYLKVASNLVEKYEPDQYQVSVGFPLLISITLTWNTKK